MTTPRKNSNSGKPKRPPATTPKGREDQMISLAFDQAERQLIEGTAPAPVVIHYLKLASSREKLEQEKLMLEQELLRARSQNLRSGGTQAELYEKAIKAFRGYRGEDEEDDYDGEIIY